MKEKVYVNTIYMTEKIEETMKFFARLGLKVSHKFNNDVFEMRTLENETGFMLDILNNERN